MKPFLLLLLCNPIVIAAQTSLKQYDDFINAWVKVKDFSGVVLVMKNDKPFFQKAVGWADKEWDVQNTMQTKFRVGSITKQFTAAAILQLAAAGKLQLHDKLSQYIPDYPKGDSVTIHMLLNHTSGIKNYTDLPSFWKSAAIVPLPPDSIINVFKDESYDFSPGTSWKYSNSGYFLLGRIIQKVSGESYRDYIFKNCMQRAGLTHTDVDRWDTILPYRAQGYSVVNHQWKHANHISMEAPYSAGAIVSDAYDLYTWTKALHQTKILPAEWLQKMLAPYKQSYGYGILIDSLKGHRRIWHNGGINGFSSNLTYYPNEDICVVVFSNNESNSDAVANGLQRMLFNLDVIIPYVPKEVPVDIAILQQYTGKWLVIEPIELLVRNNKLYRHREGAPDVELKPESPTRFFYADNSDRFIEFKVDSKDKVIKAFFIGPDDEKIEMKRMEK